MTPRPWALLVLSVVALGGAHGLVRPSPPATRRRVRALAGAHSGRTLGIDPAFPGVRYMHRDPDVVVIDGLIDGATAESIIEKAKMATLTRSPVAYGGWTEDVREVTRLVASGPATWVALLAVRGEYDALRSSPLSLAALALGTWVGCTALAAAGASVWSEGRKRDLQALRTSTSVTIDDDALVADQLMRLLGHGTVSRTQFEDLTIIRYAKGERLAPHFDATPNADVERPGGQTLATLLVYLNDVEAGGTTRFNRLGVDVAPKRGDACLFFPADLDGAVDERLEHEGTVALDEKWVARIWVHERHVPKGHRRAAADAPSPIPSIG